MRSASVNKEGGDVSPDTIFKKLTETNFYNCESHKRISSAYGIFSLFNDTNSIFKGDIEKQK